MPTLYITIWPPEVFGAKKVNKCIRFVRCGKWGGGELSPQQACKATCKKTIDVALNFGIADPNYR